MKGDGPIRITPRDILIVAFVDQVAITMSQQGLSILSVDFKNYAHLGVAQMGILFSTVALGAILGMIPAGAALDRLGSKRIAWISGVAIFVVMGILAFWLPTHFVPLMALLGLVGFFLPTLSLTGATAITKVFDGSSYEGMAIGLRQAATPLGGIIAASLFPLLVKTWTLKTVLFVIALNVGGWTILFGSILHSSSLPMQKSSTSYDWRRLWRLIKELTSPLIVSSLLSPGQYALLTYAILDLHDRWHIHLTYAACHCFSALRWFCCPDIHGTLNGPWRSGDSAYTAHSPGWRRVFGNLGFVAQGNTVCGFAAHIFRFGSGTGWLECLVNDLGCGCDHREGTGHCTWINRDEWIRWDCTLSSRLWLNDSRFAFVPSGLGITRCYLSWRYAYEPPISFSHGSTCIDSHRFVVITL
ncbi:MAG: hypothetical protein C7B47_16405 [Sulfobacillus thermosulfidooxidans]|uniref:Major facilitator superfamily (MFS) profile domain-containing protein n=1 Tax=Sulfobacillus thermosulfidooxidans TaxID=28034 RepID=A0A2T2WKJ2_SULTH|nr:MAG: hypothetical protein C7B47_16405 [Sulfobacillus thermosulfidooxidans]